MSRRQRLSRGLARMEERGWSLVRVGDRWSFTMSRTVEGGVVVDSPLVCAGDVLRLGFWATPEAALKEIGGTP